MLRWTRAWTLPCRGIGPSSSSFSRLPIAPSSSQGGTEPRSVKGVPWEAVPRSSLPRLPLPSVCPSWLRFLRLGPPSPRPLTSPAGSDPCPTLDPPVRPVPLSYKLLDGEAASPPLVFLHGLFGSKANFSSIAKALAQQTGRRVSFWSRRGPEGGGVWVGGALEEAEVWPASLSLRLGRGGSL